MKKILISALFFVLLLGQALPAFAQETKSYSASELLSSAKELLGVKYRSSGTTPKGFDCSGFTSYVFKLMGIELPHSSRAQATLGTKVKKGEWKIGDLLFFKTNGKSISHVGIFIGNNKMINSSSSHGVSIANFISEPYWSKRYVSSVRIASFEEEKVEKIIPTTVEQTDEVTTTNPTNESDDLDNAEIPDENE